MKGYSKSVLVQSDSTKKDSLRENLYIITETQLRNINQQSIDFDSLKIRFRELATNNRNSLTTIKSISKQVFDNCNEESKYSGIVIKNDAKIKRGLNLRNVWLQIRTPLVGIGLFYLGYKAGVNNWITLTF